MRSSAWRTAGTLLTSIAVVAANASTASAKTVEVVAPGDDSLHARAFAGAQRERAWRAAMIAPEARLDEYKRAARCADDVELEEPGIDQQCYIPPGIRIEGPTCEDGPAVQPLWFRSRTSPQAPWSAWEMLVGWSCPEHLLPPVDVEELRVLNIAPPEVGVQPAAEMLVNNATRCQTTPIARPKAPLECMRSVAPIGERREGIH